MKVRGSPRSAMCSLRIDSGMFHCGLTVLPRILNFPLVPVGAPGEFVYQPVKAGTRGGTVYVETHRDIYGYAPALYREAEAALARAGLADHVDQQLLVSALDDPAGMPIRVTPESSERGQVVRTSAPVEHPKEQDDRGVPHQDDDEAGDD